MNNDGFKRIAGLFVPGCISARIDFSIEEIELGNPLADTYNEYWKVWATILHEWVHFLQITGTIFGRYFFHAQNMVGASISTFLKNMFKERELSNVRKPLIRYIMNNYERDELDNLWTGLWVLSKMNTLMGFCNGPILSFNNVQKPMNDICPSIYLSDKKYLIGAYYIMEAHAFANEMVHVLSDEKLSNNIYISQIQNKELFYPYIILLQYAKDKMNEDVYDLFIVRILCDIALNVTNRDTDPSIFGMLTPLF